MASNTLFCMIFAKGLPKLRSTLPRCRRALQGFNRDEPDQSKDPAPEEALALIVQNLLDVDARTGGDLLALCAAAASVIQFDLSCRPSEALALLPENVIEAQGKHHPFPAVIFHPQAAAKTVVSRKITSKSGHLDDTVLSCMEQEPNHPYTQVLMALRAAARPEERLLGPLTLPAYERILHACAGRSGLSALELSPHAWRHGSASKALSKRLLTEKQLITRMRVMRLETARRYAKAGKLQRQVALMGRALRLRGEAMLLATSRPANPFLELAFRLRSSLRRRRRASGV